MTTGLSRTRQKENRVGIILSIEELTDLVTRVLAAHGMSHGNAQFVAAVIAAAERDGSSSHGIFRIPGYVSTLKSGWVDGYAVPIVTDAAPGLVVADARNGFAQVALAAGRELLAAKARQQGIAALAIHNSHHFAALWPDVEQFATAGFVAVAFANTRSRIVPWGGTSRLFGTNPMAFACPRRNGPPMVWDQASSVMAHGEILIAAKEGRTIPEGVGLDAAGNATNDPRAILDGGALCPFAGHKGSAIALMVEIMAAGMTGGRFGFEDKSSTFPGAQTSNAGEFIMLIDPQQTAGDLFFERIERLFGILAQNGQARLPGERRYRARIRSEEHGIVISRESHDALMKLLNADRPNA